METLNCIRISHTFISILIIVVTNEASIHIDMQETLPTSQGIEGFQIDN